MKITRMWLNLYYPNRADGECEGPWLSLWAALPARTQLHALGISVSGSRFLAKTQFGPSLGMQGHSAKQTEDTARVSQQTESKPKRNPSLR